MARRVCPAPAGLLDTMGVDPARASKALTAAPTQGASGRGLRKRHRSGWLKAPDDTSPPCPVQGGQQPALVEPRGRRFTVAAPAAERWRVSRSSASLAAIRHLADVARDVTSKPGMASSAADRRAATSSNDDSSLARMLARPRRIAWRARSGPGLRRPVLCVDCRIAGDSPASLGNQRNRLRRRLHRARPSPISVGRGGRADPLINDSAQWRRAFRVISWQWNRPQKHHIAHRREANTAD